MGTGTDNSYGIVIEDLTLSLAVSFANLCINFYSFRKEARLHGTTIPLYALSVLQMAEVPIQKFVPRLPAIEKGLIDKVNFGGFKFDKASVTPLLEALHSTKCKLKSMKLSITSLSNLDLPSCTMLGYLLYNAKVLVTFSRTSSLLDIKRLFEKLDEDKSGYLDLGEFHQAIETLGCSLKNASDKIKKRVFKQLAIRRIKKRDRIYFYDFFHKTTNVRDVMKNAFDYDITQIEYPLHFVFIRIKQSIEAIINGQNLNQQQERLMLRQMRKLYNFCDGSQSLNQTDKTVNQHIFYSILDIFYVTDTVQDEKILNKLRIYMDWVWDQFLHLLKSRTITVSLYLQRNNKFHTEEIDFESKRDFFRKLKIKHCEGYNIFEYCFYLDANTAKCKLFVYLLDAFLFAAKNNNKIRSNINYYKKLIFDEKGHLYELFQGTSGFHVVDKYNNTPLYYAVYDGQKLVVDFYSKYIISNGQDEIFEIDWINDQDYFFTIIHGLFQTKQHSNAEILRSLLNCRKIDINYDCKLYGGYLGHQLLRYRASHCGSQHREFLMECLKILYDFKYDFVNNIDSASNNNILHYAVLLKDYNAVGLILDLFKSTNNDKSNENLSQLLNFKNKQQKTALLIAMDKVQTNIAELLLRCDQQQLNLSQLTTRMTTTFWSYQASDTKWITCLYNIIIKTKGEILQVLSENDVKTLSDFIKSLLENPNENANDYQQRKHEYQLLQTVIDFVNEYYHKLNADQMKQALPQKLKTML